jgi:hypothetical protein
VSPLEQGRLCGFHGWMKEPSRIPRVRGKADFSVKDAIPAIRAELEELDAQRSELESERARLLVVLEWAAARGAPFAPLRTVAPGAPAETGMGEHGPGTSGATGPESSSIPQRVLALVDAAPERTWTIREFADQLYGEGASRSHLETARKSALRLVERGALRRVDKKHFRALTQAVRN